jgi:hypothetical protein
MATGQPLAGSNLIKLLMQKLVNQGQCVVNATKSSIIQQMGGMEQLPFIGT